MNTPDIDHLINQFDSALRALGGVGQPSRPSPATHIPNPELSETEKTRSGRMMRVNHCGEICAQALYLGQGMTSDDPRTQASMRAAAREESDHLLWCESRLEELGTHKSILNPFFFAASFAGGAVSGLLGNQFNLGFVAATEEQVVKHLDEHLGKLPENDERSRAILEQMRNDEDEHRTNALRGGGSNFPRPVKKLMTAMSRLMTRSTYWV